MKTSVLPFILILVTVFLLSSCSTVSETYHQPPDRAGQNIDTARDTLVKTFQRPRSKRVSFEIYYLNDKRLFIRDFDYEKDGIYVIYWKKGHFKKSQGEAYTCYANGSLWGRVMMVDGKPEGLSQNFYPNGVFLGEEPFKAGKKHGTARYFWDNGQLYAEFDYEKNRLRAVRGLYDKQGNFLPKGNFENGNGELWLYDDAGEKVEKIEIYRNGKMRRTRKP